MSSNTVLVLQAVISGGGVVASVVVSAFVAGGRWGRLQNDVTALRRDLAKIEGMFILKLRDGE